MNAKRNLALKNQPKIEQMASQNKPKSSEIVTKLTLLLFLALMKPISSSNYFSTRLMDPKNPYLFKYGKVTQGMEIDQLARIFTFKDNTLSAYTTNLNGKVDWEHKFTFTYKG